MVSIVKEKSIGGAQSAAERSVNEILQWGWCFFLNRLSQVHRDPALFEALVLMARVVHRLGDDLDDPKVLKGILQSAGKIPGFKGDDRRGLCWAAHTVLDNLRWLGPDAQALRELVIRLADALEAPA